VGKQFFMCAIVLLALLVNVFTFGQESFTLNVSLKFPNDNGPDTLINNLKSTNVELSYVYEITISGENYFERYTSTSPILSLNVSQQGVYEVSVFVIVGKDIYFYRCGYGYSRLQFFKLKI